jgi:hypothetical protein
VHSVAWQLYNLPSSPHIPCPLSFPRFYCLGRAYLAALALASVLHVPASRFL